MKAIVITEAGGPEVLKLMNRPDAVCTDEEVLIEVKAAGVNRPDVFQRKGNYPAPKGVVPDIPGLEVAGQIVAVGAAVSRWQIGDEVCALVAGGGYATLVSAHADLCLPVPNGITYAEAAILPETIYTVWDNVFRRGALKHGEHLLVHGGTGGIGSTAIQLAKACGARVSTTAGSAEKCLFCKELGADIAINYKEEDFAERLKGEGVNVILDSIGGSYFEKNIDILTADGRLVYINAMQGKQVSLDIVSMMQKRLQITGSTLRSREVAFKAQLTREIQEFIWPLIGDTFKPQLYKKIPLADAAESHRLMENGDLLGKLVLTI
ncbi:NAD(P)H-quinone oxidoreductase [Sphingobacterium oryzagri]|uniref:NAD(P)H-quinone oxidoreductase n=1 Tax=Sphingobacterium oryzagri TaxID=3025669 RepID=A0ABY7WQI9_9SPHI|nr:NAD(P)H-quinone oxidoreductase [Sphingobacterium sp. KACC 22765]WDF70809.1 NAD(P)H-quinone oxidoreductase [Sphingobacterium sp. KACC 22765]